MDLQTTFIKHITANNLFNKNDRLLLAISGGVDSMVMLHLCRQCGFSFETAHCNFHLRSDESDRDEAFVEHYCRQAKIKVYLKHFNTTEFAKNTGISIEMAARKLRYEWFEQLRTDNNLDFILTAHHLNDEAETFHINISRGTGIRGLSGIPEKSGRIVRPMLHFTRNQIETYAKDNSIPYRTDSSNESDEFTRNKIRHRIIPELKKINPGYLESVAKTIRNLKDVKRIYLKQIEDTRKEILHEKEDKVYIDIKKLQTLSPLKTYLYELLRPYRFNESTVKDIINSFNSSPGLMFYSPTHRLIRDRENLIITKTGKIAPQEFQIPAPGKTYLFNKSQPDEIILHPVIIENTKGLNIPNGKKNAWFDHANIRFPLYLRKWQTGDFFYPFGMKGKKKLSNYFIDNKIPRDEKEKIWLLCSGNDIIWIVGYRTDNRYRVQKSTAQILSIEIL